MGVWEKFKRENPQRKAERLRKMWSRAGEAYKHVGGGCSLVSTDKYCCDDEYQNKHGKSIYLSTTKEAHFSMPSKVMSEAELLKLPGVKKASRAGASMPSEKDIEEYDARRKLGRSDNPKMSIDRLRARKAEIERKITAYYAKMKDNPLSVSLDASAKEHDRGEYLSYGADEVRFLVRKPESVRDMSRRHLADYARKIREQARHDNPNCPNNDEHTPKRHCSQCHAEWAEDRYSKGIYAGRYCIPCWKAAAYIDKSPTGDEIPANVKKLLKDLSKSDKETIRHMKGEDVSMQDNPSLARGYESASSQAAFHHVRVAEPKWSRYVTKPLGDSRVQAVYGVDGGKTHMQKLLFPKDAYSIPQIQSWLRKHKLGKLKQ